MKNCQNQNAMKNKILKNIIEEEPMKESKKRKKESKSLNENQEQK